MESLCRKINTTIWVILLACLSFPLIGADYYWIGGSGNWSDLSHWVTASGGSITHPQAPTANDNVIFDANSFTAPGQVVILSTDIIFCKNMIWTNVGFNPTLQANGNVTLNVYGSFLLSEDMLFNNEGKIIFSGSGQEKNIDFKSYNAGTDVTFSGSGSWSLQSPIILTDRFTFNEGDIITNGQPINCSYFYSNSTKQRNLELGSSIITIEGNTKDISTNPEFDIKPLVLDATNLSINPGTSVIDLTASQVDIWMLGDGTIDLNRVVLSREFGNSRLYSWKSDPQMNYKELELSHLAFLDGDPFIENLILHPSKRYKFEGNRTFTFGDITAIGNCIENILIEAADGGSTTFKTSNNIILEYVSARGINVVGSGSISIDDGIDLGNNSNLTILPRQSKNYYWVQNGGDWNDPSHWSLSSGGPSSGCVPSGLDNVFFDQNSFSSANQIVTINIENAYCRDMDWTGAQFNPTLDGPVSNGLHLSGSLTFIATMVQDFKGIFFFESNEQGNTITSAGKRFNEDVMFDGENGEWTLLDEMSVHNAIEFRSGTLRTNDQDVDCKLFFSVDDFRRWLYLGNTHWKVDARGESSPEWKINSSNLVFDAGTSTIEPVGIYTCFFENWGRGTMRYNIIKYSSFSGIQKSYLTNPAPRIYIDSLLFLQSGDLHSDHDINYLYLAPGHRYTFSANDVQYINELDANGDCPNGNITIRSNVVSEPTFFDIDQNHNLEQLNLEDVHQIGSGSLRADNSIDSGNNNGWIINTKQPRTLYWVGDSGEWADMNNWSLSSGGPGGECIPTPLDDIIFDENSFSSPEPVISHSINNHRFCRDMTWTDGITEKVTIYGNNINISGSLDIQKKVHKWDIGQIWFKGIDDDHTIRTSGTTTFDFTFEGTGTYTILDYVLGKSWTLYRGNLNTNSQDISLRGFYVRGFGIEKTLDLGSSHIEIYGETITRQNPTFAIRGAGLTINPGTSVISFTDERAGMLVNIPVELNNVVFNQVQGKPYIESNSATFNSIFFAGDGEIVGRLTTDTLLCTPGKTYILASEETQTINSFWRIIGNNCTPIELVSSILGNHAFVSMPPASTLIADFIQMRDISASGGANFLAGRRSTNIDQSNEGWIFDTAPQFVDVGFLGPDRALCNDFPVTLDAYNYSPGETYMWHDGSTDSVFVTYEPGVFYVDVTFLDDCMISDTVEIRAPIELFLELPEDTLICEGIGFLINAEMDHEDAVYTWQDGSTEPRFFAEDPGIYYVNVFVDGCNINDTIQVDIFETPNPFLGEDIIECGGGTFTLQPQDEADTYLWQDGSTEQTFTGDQGGIYWVEVSNGRCTDRDSILVSYSPNPVVDLGPDTLICTGSDFYLYSGYDTTATFLWQDGSQNEYLEVNSPGTFWVEVTENGCSGSDTINVQVIQTPEVELEDLWTACEGDIISISTPVSGDAYIWSDGSTGTDFQTDQSGNYYLDVVFGECVVREEFEVQISAYPVIEDFGPELNLCEGESFLLEAVYDIGTLTWQDGSSSNAYFIDEAGTYTATVANGDCISTESISVQVTPLPSIDLGDDLSGCEGEEFNLDIAGDYDFHFWEDGSSNFTRTISNSGTYWVEVEKNGCIASDTIEINFAELPVLELGNDTIICDVTPHTIIPFIGEGNFSWENGYTDNNLLVPAPGTFVATLDRDGCVVKDSVTIDFIECTIFTPFTPNVFSPNNDLINDVFNLYVDPEIEIIEYSLNIFNRWGGHVYESDDYSQGWDGKLNGKFLDAGVYVYFIELTYRDDLETKSTLLKGDITLVQ